MNELKSFRRESDENTKNHIFLSEKRMTPHTSSSNFFGQVSNRNACLLSEIKKSRNNQMYFVLLPNGPCFLNFNSGSTRFFCDSVYCIIP
jgi:hypothetical protein